MPERLLRFSTISLIAVMVWLYAEGATRRQQTVTWTLELAPPEGQMLQVANNPSSERPTQLTVTATIRCSSGQLEQVKRAMADPGKPIEIKVADEAGRSQRSLNLLERLAGHERINRLGITLERVEPNDVIVKVDRLETRTMQIELVTPPNLELAEPATFQPKEIAVTLPAVYAATLDSSRLRARLDANALAGVKPGVPEVREVEVSVPPELASANVALAVRKVSVTFTVKKKEEEATIAFVDVVLLIPPGKSKLYDVVVDPESLQIADLKVKGPSDVMAEIVAKKRKIEAALRLGPEDLEKRIESKAPELLLPPGVTVESPPRLIKFKITPRDG